MKAIVRSRRGSIFLPVIGFMTYLPWFLFGTTLLAYYQDSVSDGVRAMLAIPLMFGAFVVSIALGVFNEGLEWEATRCGLAEHQLWSGENRREKCLREVWRVSLFLLSGVAAVVCALRLPENLALQIFGGAAFWQGFVVLFFLLCVVPLKNRWPNLGGFSGDRDARFFHAW